MRVLLINPHYPISETPSPPLGLACLGAVLERAGMKVGLLDFVVFPYSKRRLESELEAFRPNMVGITAVSMTYDHAATIMRDVKEIDAHVATVMGGPHVTFRAEKTLRELPELDVVALGEGDDTIVDLAITAQNGRRWHDVPGVVYRDGDDIRRTPARSRFVDVNALPLPARHLLPLGRYRALGMPVSMTTSRGCPFKCIFCVGRKMVGAKVRYRNPESVVDELAYLSGLGFHQINVADDLFTASRDHCLTICDEIVRRGLQIQWTAFSRVDTVSEDMLAHMRAAGCRTVSFGVESANSEILKRIRKGISVEQAVAAIRMCVDAGVTPHVSFILGLPGETPETLKETAEFGERLKDMGALYGFHLLTPFPGTEVREQKEKYGIRILTDDWRQYHANRAVVETPRVSRRMMDEMAVAWERKYDEWLDYVKYQMERGKATEEEAWQLIKLVHTVLLYDLMMEEIIEKQGVWKRDGGSVSLEAGIQTLTERIAAATKYTRNEAVRTVEYAVKQGFLTHETDGERVHWDWVNYL